MALSLCNKVGLVTAQYYAKKKANMKVRELMTPQLFQHKYGEPLSVVRCKECQVPLKGPRDVVMHMLAAPVHSSDLRVIKGQYDNLKLPRVCGAEGVGEVMEVGHEVDGVAVGQRVIVTGKHQGTWRQIAVCNQSNVRTISPKVPVTHAAMFNSMCTAYRLLKDFKPLYPGDTIIQNAPNSPVGQCVVQYCKTWLINTINIMPSYFGLTKAKENLSKLGASVVCTASEAQEYGIVGTRKPVLALNSLRGDDEALMLRMLGPHGTMAYYEDAAQDTIQEQDTPQAAQKPSPRYDVSFHQFDFNDWNDIATEAAKETMYNEIAVLIVTGKIQPPKHQMTNIENYKHAIKQTNECAAFANDLYVFEFNK